MTSILVDHNMEGQAVLLLGTLQEQGWASLLDIHFLRLTEAGLSEASSDREVWRWAQEYQMILLTDTRRISGADSLEQVIREENVPAALPVLTVTAAKRLYERLYRENCATRLAEIMIDLEQYLGAGRLLLP